MASTLLRSVIVAVLFAQASALAVDMHLHSRPSAFNKVSPAANNVLNAPRVAFQPVCAGGGSGGGIRLRGGGGGGGGDGNGDGDGNIISKFWAKYLALLDEKPLQTRIITGFLIGAFGDVISQISGGTKASALDIKRLLIFSSWGGFGFTPVGYNWYNFIEAIVPKNISARFFWKMLVDQSVFPGIMTAITFITLTVVEGLFVGVSLTLDQGLRSTGVAVRGLPTLLDEGVRKVRKELVPTLITNYKVWPLAQILNFAVVPIKLQVLFVNIVAVWWNFVLSMTQHN